MDSRSGLDLEAGFRGREDELDAGYGFWILGVYEKLLGVALEEAESEPGGR